MTQRASASSMDGGITGESGRSHTQARHGSLSNIQKSSYRWTDPTALIEPSTASARAAVQRVREQLPAQASEPQGRSVQDTSFMLGGSSLLSFWNNLREDRGASFWPNPTFAVVPVDENSPQHCFLTSTCPLSLLNCLWTYLLTCVAPAQPSARHIRPIQSECASHMSHA
jgi:hypothetical protein